MENDIWKYLAITSLVVMCFFAMFAGYLNGSLDTYKEEYNNIIELNKELNNEMVDYEMSNINSNNYLIDCTFIFDDGYIGSFQNVVSVMGTTFYQSKRTSGFQQTCIIKEVIEMGR